MNQGNQPEDAVPQQEHPIIGSPQEVANILPDDDLPELPPQWALDLIERTSMIELIINKAVEANYEFRRLLDSHIPADHQDWMQVRRLTEEYDYNMIDLLEFCIPSVWEGLNRLRQEFVELNIPEFPLHPFDNLSPSNASNPTPPVSSEASSTDTETL